jgi:AcrR family transcriptional regulator
MRVMSATVRPRRTQRERREATVAALLGCARDRFAADGYLATSLDAIAAEAGVTKGALYHHFAGKEELFAAVHAGEHRRLGAIAEAAAGEHAGPWTAIEAALAAFVAAAREPGTQRITVHEAPLALSRSALRATPLHDLLERHVAAAGGHDPLALARLLHAAACEAAASTALDDPGGAAERELRALVRALAAAPTA